MSIRVIIDKAGYTDPSLCLVANHLVSKKDVWWLMDPYARQKHT